MLCRNSTTIMLLLCLLLTGSGARSTEYSPDPQNAIANPYMDELLSVLSKENGQELLYFSELDTVAARYNLSLPKYTHACLGEQILRLIIITSFRFLQWDENFYGR